MGPKPNFDLRVTSDPTGFPMIWVQAVEAWVQWLPVTKVQMEIFLSHTRDPAFDSPWYERANEGNARVSGQSARGDNYWGALQTGILPQEAEIFARWCGEEYRIPSAEAWLKAYVALKQVDAQELDWTQRLPGASHRCRELLEALGATARLASQETYAVDDPYYSYNLADQTLMRLGALEWVHDEASSDGWGGLGELNPRFASRLSVLEHEESVQPLDPFESRVSYCGFRLWKTEPSRGAPA